MTSDGQSEFRNWFGYLQSFRGRRVEWPQLMRYMFRDELDRIRKTGKHYEGWEVFIDRDQTAVGHIEHPEQHREVLSVYRLYRSAHQECQGCLSVGDERIWLVSCEVPNQGVHGQRTADLLGVRLDGSLVVFECKVAANRSNSPLHALIEGLDYLGHLLIEKNFERLQAGFLRWKAKHALPGALSQTPPGFEGVVLNLQSPHTVLVLAPKSYFAIHRKDSNNVEQDWELLSDRHWPNSPGSVRLDFAVVSDDFSPTDSELLQLQGL